MAHAHGGAKRTAPLQRQRVLRGSPIIISCLGSTVVVYALKIEIMYINYNTTRSKTCTDNVIVIIVDSSPRL